MVSENLPVELNDASRDGIYQPRVYSWVTIPWLFKSRLGQRHFDSVAAEFERLSLMSDIG